MKVDTSIPHVYGPAMVRIRWSALALVALFAALPVFAQPQLPKRAPLQRPMGLNIAGKVDFPISLIPRIPASLPLIKMTAQRPPVVFLKENLTKIGIPNTAIQPLSRVPSLAMRRIPDQVTGVVEKDQIRAYWNEQTGEAEIYPRLEQLKTERFMGPNSRSLAPAVSLAKSVFSRADILPKDSTQFVIGQARPLLGASAQKGANGVETAPAEQLQYLTYVPVHREVQGFTVHGPGSRAMIGVDNAGAIQSFLLRWKTGTAGVQASEKRTPQQIHEALRAVVAPLAKQADVQVLTVGIVYYDDDGEQMNPAYRLTARVHTNPPVGQRAGSDDYVVLYAPYGNAPLSPTLNPTGGEQPRNANPNTGQLVPDKSAIAEGDPTVGRYVVRNDNAGWVNNANGFWTGLTFPFGNAAFTNSQYFWAYPWEFTTNQASYINSVQVGLTEAHGDWWFFTTYQNWGDGVNIDTIPASGGYGSANHGHLNYWILHSCEVVASAADAPCPAGSPRTDTRTWYHNWFNVFKGLHTVVGYRTIMYINDGVGFPFGLRLQWGQPVISSWFNAVLSDSDYFGNPMAQAHCGLNYPMGKPSAVTVCGHSNDTIFNQENIPAASCLTNFWQPN